MDRHEAARVLEAAAWALGSWRGRHPPQVCEEIAQEASARALLAVGVSNRRAFAVTTARRLAIDVWRRDRRTVSLVPDLGQADPVDRAGVVEARRDVALIRRRFRRNPAARELLDVLLEDQFDELHGGDPVARERWRQRRIRALRVAREILEVTR